MGKRNARPAPRNALWSEESGTLRRRLRRRASPICVATLSHTNSSRNSRPRIFAARCKVSSVTPELSGSSKRSSCARLVCIISAMARLVMPFLHRRSQLGVAKRSATARYPDEAAPFAGAIEQFIEDQTGILGIFEPPPEDVEEGPCALGRRLLDLALRAEEFLPSIACLLPKRPNSQALRSSLSSAIAIAPLAKLSVFWRYMRIAA